MSIRVPRALALRALEDLRSNVVRSLVFTRFPTRLRTSLSLIDPARPAKFRIFSQLFEICGM
jgi:hypothetical protein